MAKRDTSNRRNQLQARGLRDGRGLAMVKTKSGVLVPVNPGKVLFSDDDWRRIGLILKLSRRELQVARLTAEYQRRKNIARRLGLSPHTISTIAERVFRKLRVTGQVPLVLNFVWLQQAVQV